MGKCSAITQYQNRNFVKVYIAPLCCQPLVCRYIQHQYDSVCANTYFIIIIIIIVIKERFNVAFSK